MKLHVFSLAVSLVQLLPLIDGQCACGQSEMDRLKAYCNTFSNSKFYNGHCYYLSTVRQPTFDTNVDMCYRDCVSDVNGPIPNVISRIANFYTNSTYTSVMLTTPFLTGKLKLQIGLRKNVNNKNNYQDYYWVKSSGNNQSDRVPLIWYFGGLSNQADDCTHVHVDQMSASFHVAKCASYKTDGQICEIMCLDDNNPCNYCVTTNVTKILDTTLCLANLAMLTVNDPIAVVTKALSSLTSPSYKTCEPCAVMCNNTGGIMLNGSCYALVNTPADFSTASDSCVNMGNTFSSTGRLANFRSLDDFTFVTNKSLRDYQLDGDTRPGDAWIGVTSPCLCNTNYTNLYFIDSSQQRSFPISNIFPPYDVSYELSPFTTSTCASVENIGNFRQYDCTSQRAYICEILCDGRAEKTSNLTSVQCSDGSTVTDDDDSNLTISTSATLGWSCYPTTPLATTTKATSSLSLSKKVVVANVSSAASTTQSSETITIKRNSTPLNNLSSVYWTTQTSETTNIENTTPSSDMTSAEASSNIPTSVAHISTSQYLSTKETSYPITKAFHVSTQRTHSNAKTIKMSRTSEISRATTETSSLTNCNTDWTTFSACSASCGNAIQIRTRKKYNISNNNCTTEADILSCNLKACDPLTPPIRITVDVLQTLGCTWLIVLCFFSILVGILLRSWDTNRFIHASQEIALALAHILIASVRNETQRFLLCTWTAIIVQYFFLVVFAFLLLEAVEIYSVVTTVVVKKTFLNLKMMALIGWGAPFIVTAITAFTSYNHYISQFSCWLNFEHKIAFGTFVPVATCVCIAAVLLEAAGQRANPDFNFGNGPQITTAKINQRSLLFMIPLQVAAWFVGQSAVYFQYFALFTTVFALNTSLGACIGFFHIWANKESRALVIKMFPCLDCKKKNRVQAEK